MPPPLVCTWCQSPFADRRPPGTRGPRPSYCSRECRLAKKRDYNTGRNAERRLLEQCVDCPSTGTLDALPGTSYCAEHTARHVARDMASTLSRYGLTADALVALYERQAGRCAICGTTEAENGQRLAIDHDHSCCAGDRSCGKCVRALLCSGCNLGLGNFQDSVSRLASAAAYLTSFVR